jgi:hypothetical protein
MKQPPNLGTTFVLLAIAAPLSVNAKAIPTAPGSLKRSEVDVARPTWIKDRITAAGIRTDLADAPFRFRLMAGAATIKVSGFAHDWGDGSLSLNTMRVKSSRKAEGIMPFSFNRFSALHVNLGLVQDLNSHDSLSLGASYAQERRRPSFSVAAHNAHKTNNAAITLGWTHDESFRLNASLYSTAPNRARSIQERIVELAGGTPLAARGMALAASFSPNHDPDKFSFGVDLRS